MAWFKSFSTLLHHFVLTKLTTSSQRVEINSTPYNVKLQVGILRQVVTSQLFVAKIQGYPGKTTAYSQVALNVLT